jgi:hypothetical protein
MEYRDKVLSVAKTSPVLPMQIAKALSTDSMMAGAMLSEMVSKGLLKTSSLKVGGSPVYYVPGNEAQLLNFRQNLNEKDRRTVELLEKEKVLRESEVDPLTRVSLGLIKDFAKPLIVTYDGKQETFFKWFLVGDKEAEEHIRIKLQPAEAQPVEKKVEAVKPEPMEQQQVLEPKPAKLSGDFWDRMQSFFASNNIKILEQTVVKKKTEFDLLLQLPSPVGSLTYYCKARSKKRVSDSDLSAAYVQGQIKKLPVILLIDGELSKQAKELQGQLKGLVVSKV